eukprot:65399_1
MSYTTNTNSSDIINNFLDTVGIKIDAQLMQLLQNIHEKAIALDNMELNFIPNWTRDNQIKAFSQKAKRSDFDFMMIVWTYTMYLIQKHLTFEYLIKSFVFSVSHYNFNKLNEFSITLKKPLEFKQQYGLHLSSTNIKSIKKFILLCLKLKQSRNNIYTHDWIQKIILATMSHIKSYRITQNAYSQRIVNTDIKLFASQNYQINIVQQQQQSQPEFINTFPDNAIIKCVNLGYSEQQIAKCIDFMVNNKYTFNTKDIEQIMNQFTTAMDILGL